MSKNKSIFGIAIGQDPRSSVMWWVKVEWLFACNASTFGITW